MKKELFDYCLRLGDSCLILSHRLAELCSKGPFLEEDIAMTNISLDLLGRAELFLDYAGELEGKGRTADDLTYRRNERQYFNHLITERPNTDFAHVMLRQYLHDAMMAPLLNALQQSSDERISAIAGKGYKESAYHLRHSRSWVIRLSQGTEESRRRMEEALNELWTYTAEMFEYGESEKSLVSQGIINDFVDLKKKWLEEVRSAFDEAGLDWPGESWMATGGRLGIHSEYLGHILGDMQYLPRAYPNDKW